MTIAQSALLTVLLTCVACASTGTYADAVEGLRWLDDVEDVLWWKVSGSHVYVGLTCHAYADHDRLLVMAAKSGYRWTGRRFHAHAVDASITGPGRYPIEAHNGATWPP